MAAPRPNFFSSRVIRRLLAIFLGCAVLPVLVLAVGTLDRVSAQLEEQARERLKSASKAAAMSVVTELLDIRSWAEVGADLGAVDAGGLERSNPADTHLRVLLRSLSLFRGADRPTVVFGAPPALPELSAEVRGHLARGRAWLTTLSVSGGDPAIVLVQAIGPVSDDPELVVTEIDPEPLFTDAVRAGLPSGARYWVLDDASRVLFAGGPGGRVALPPRIRDDIHRAVSGELTWESEGETWLGGYWSVFLKPQFLTPHWTLVVAESRSRVLAPVETFRTIFPLSAGLCLAVSSLVLLMQLRKRMAPLGELTEAASRISRRDFDVDVWVHSGDEFEDLARSFNGMAQRLNQQFDSLAQLIEIDRALLSSVDERHIVRTLAEGTLRLSGRSPVAVMMEENDRPGSMRVSIEPSGVNRKAPALDPAEGSRLLDAAGGLLLRTDDPEWSCLAALSAESMGRVLVLPLSVDRRAVGLVAIALDAAEGLEPESEVLVRQLADQASVAFSNARAAERNRLLAHYDVLTGLPNRLLFAERLEQALLRARRPGQMVGVGLIDLDGFKRVNDTFGHGAGDDLLRQVARRLESGLRRGTLARMGGDEFTFILGDLTDADALARASRRLIDALDTPFLVDGREIFVAASVGLAVSPEDGSDVEALLRNADAAMYHAKLRTGSSFRFYDASMNAAALERLELEHAIRMGLERDEFVVHYQPIVEAETRDVVGVEALVRWRHPERGIVGPDDFVPVAEETGLIVGLGDRVLRTACADLRSLADEGLGPLRLSVNLSVRQLADPGVVSGVRSALEASAWPASQLVLEITESMLMSPDPESNALLRELRELGISLSIDDFGSGYSSLSYLKNFKVDHLKIDRTFVSELEHSQDDAEITAAILAMAQGLKLGVVAEGVETEAQLAYLRDRGCPWVQGYLFAPPLALDELRKWMKGPAPV